MSVFEDTLTKAKEILGETGKATEELIAVQKLKFEASSVKSSMNKNYELLGKYVYREKINEEDNSVAVNALLEEISEQIVKINDIETKIAQGKGLKICSCGTSNKTEAKYCSNCGKEI